LGHEAQTLELRKREKDNDYRMIILKLKELKRIYQGNYIRGIGHAEDKGSKKRLRRKLSNISNRSRSKTPRLKKVVVSPKQNMNKSLPSEDAHSRIS